MHSSTSSSEHAGLGPATRHVVRAGGLTVVVAALLLAGAGLVARALPRRAVPLDLETLIVDAQRQRAASIGDTDVLILGDSSALMGVDAGALGRALGGKRVESLATIGYVGPAGFATLLESYTAGGRRARTVVLIMHGISLGLGEPLFASKGFEALVAGHEPPRGRLRAARDLLYDRLLAPILDLPLPGAFGRFYGRPDRLAAALTRDHGTLVDPNDLVARDRTPFEFVLTPAVATRLDVLRAACTRLGVRELRVAIAPIPESRAGASTLAGRATVLAELVRRLAPAAALDVPAVAPDGDFATLTHLDAGGRARYTAAFARALSQ